MVKIKRKSISKKKRFEVFKRDDFTCAYCGNKPPEIILEVDHINPVSNGGGNEYSNLITSCHDCNRGKSKRLLTEKLPKKKESENLEKERNEQLSEYQKYLYGKREEKQRAIDYLQELFQKRFPGNEFSGDFKTTLIRFMFELNLEEMEYAMAIALSRIKKPEKAIKYFCGICWKKIKGDYRYPWPTDRG